MPGIGNTLKNFWRSLFPSTRTPQPTRILDEPHSRGEASPQDVRVQASLYHYAADVTEVYDGDTITVDIDLGLNIWKRGEKLRLWRINTPEVKGESRVAGLAARDYLRGLVEGRQVLLRTILDKRGDDSTEKYGRLLAEVLVPEIRDGVIESYINVNEDLLQRGYALPMGADGSMTRRVAGTDVLPPDHIACPYCGEIRQVDPVRGVVAECPNCLDDAYAL